jgi:DNA polymerase-3 subunit alpha
LQNANVLGIFQLESVGMREVIQKLKPDNLEDIIALISLYRPGPMDSISTYLARKHGEQIVTYPHPYIEDILSSTYGIMIYQEQVMKIAQAMGGYSLAQADLLRRAMGKKIPEEMAKHKQIFIDGAKKQNISTDVAASIFAQMEKFAGYGFNRSHAAAYALISYQTAYLKANYMHAFYVALMNIEIANTDKIATYVQDAKMNDIGVLPPDINKSSPIFKKEDGCIRYALGAIKGSSVSSSQEIVETRNMYGKFDSLQHFFEQIDRKSINKRQMDSLIMAGTFDCLHQNRNQVLDRFSKLSTTNTQTASQNQQRSLFNNVSKQGALCDCPEWDYMEKLEKERVAIGFYLTSHPIDMYLEVLRDVGIQKSGQFLYERQQQRQLTVAGVLLSKQEKLSKGSQKYAFITVSDQDNSYEITVLPNLYPSVSHLLISGKVLLMEINIKNMDGASRISAQLIKDVDSIISTQKIYLELDDTADIAELQKFLASLEDGSNQISFVVRNSSARYTEIETSYKKNMTIKNRDKIKQLRGIKIFKKASGLLKNFPRSTNL